MPLDLGLFSGKLKRCREKFPFSVAEVSEATGIDAATLSDLECGRREPSGDHVLILADFYKCDFRFFISNERTAAFEETETLFRRYAHDLSRDDRIAIQEFVLLCECEHYLQDVLERSRPVPFIYRRGREKRHKTQGMKAAQQFRVYLGYPPLAIVRNVFGDLRKAGFHVFRRRLRNSSISGIMVRHPGIGGCILVNHVEDTYRQNFTAAHEAGHALLDDGMDVNLSLHRWDAKDLSEIRANTFASNYFMPRELVQSISPSSLSSSDAVVRLALRIGVNAVSLVYALRERGIISPEQAKTWERLTTPRSEKVDPELPNSLCRNSRQRAEDYLARGLSGYYCDLCLEAHDRQLISRRRLAEMLLMDQEEADMVLQNQGRHLS